jgi:CubicO group peptidase (beta-lactamase class C family)
LKQYSKKEKKMNRETSCVIKLFVTLIVSCLLFLPAFAFAADKAAKIDELLHMYHEYGMFNGTVLVAEKGEVILKKGYGYADIEWVVENEPDTKFRVGSLTKQFTAMLIMQLVEENEIELNRPLTVYLPDYRRDTGDRVTIHNLLTHTSGIPNYADIPGFWSDSIMIHYTFNRLLYELCAGDLEFEPGSNIRYSNSNYVILGAIIENITGKKYEDVLRERILEPLGMENTGVDDYTQIIKNRAAGYARRIYGLINSSYIHMANFFAAGAMYSTVEDLFIWDQALYTNKLLGENYKNKMFTPFLSNYAYGWGVKRVPVGGEPGVDEYEDSVKIISHSGGITGFTSTIHRLVEDKHTVILFDNTGSSVLSDIAGAIRNILYDKPHDMPKRSVAETLYKTVVEDGVETAIEQYHILRKEQSDEYNFDESELNDLGYALLHLQKVTDAIAIFELNVEMYSDGYNTYDSLGEALMIDGQVDLAIQNYAKSLELNPNNTNAIIMLHRIYEQRQKS